MQTASRLRDSALDTGLALTRTELDAASRLVHQCYLACGYVKPSPDGRHVSPYLAMPSTAVFVARAGGEVVATVALLEDSALQLPCDELYGAELAVLRRAGRRIAEVSALAVSEECRGLGLRALHSLVQAVGVYGRDLVRADHLCIAVHPRHAAYYESRLQFQRFGGLKPYHAVNGAPAVGLLLDLRDLDRAPRKGSLGGSLFGAADRARVGARLRREGARLAADRALHIFHSPAN
jgi:N-acyl amino acid synthase FeeM